MMIDRRQSGLDFRITPSQGRNPSTVGLTDRIRRGRCGLICVGRCGSGGEGAGRRMMGGHGVMVVMVLILTEHSGWLTRRWRNF